MVTLGFLLVLQLLTTCDFFKNFDKQTFRVTHIQGFKYFIKCNFLAFYCKLCTFDYYAKNHRSYLHFRILFDKQVIIVSENNEDIENYTVQDRTILKTMEATKHLWLKNFKDVTSFICVFSLKYKEDKTNRHSMPNKSTQGPFYLGEK